VYVVRVSVITLTWNHLDYTKRALESLKPILNEDDEVIVIDNNSIDGTKEYLASLDLPCYKNVYISDKHMSITEAYNKGITMSQGRYIFIYNNDLEIVEPDTLNHLVNTADDHADAGIVCPHTDHLIGRLRNIPDQSKKFHRIEEFHMKKNRPYPVCPSAAWLIKRKVIDDVGLFDENYKGYGMLDFDYARAVMLKGYKILLDGHVFVKHYGSITARDYDIQPMLRESAAYFWRKWGLPAVDTRPERFRGRSSDK